MPEPVSCVFNLKEGLTIVAADINNNLSVNCNIPGMVVSEPDLLVLNSDPGSGQLQADLIGSQNLHQRDVQSSG
jgi:hypothetical protein